jgi:hypothetical protein
MADITMCRGKHCPLKESCFRYKAERNIYWQSEFQHIPYENGECKYFWDITKMTEQQKTINNRY